MGLARYHSRVFAAWRAVHDQLDGVAWPSPPRGTVGVCVAFGDDYDPDKGREVVGVVPVVDDDVIAWQQMGGSSRVERFGFDVVYRCNIPGMNPGQVVDRLEEIADEIQSLWYTTATATFTPPPFDGVQALGGVASVNPEVFPSEHGWLGTCTIRLLIEARI